MTALGVEPEYLALVDPETLAPVDDDRPDALLVAVAARVGDDAADRQHPAPSTADQTTGGAEAAMQRVMLKSKIHRATVTDCDLHYVGSITIDPDLLEAADILEHEQVHVVDVDNGARFETYTIAGERGSGEMKVNGAAARLVHRGDTIIVISYGQYDQADLESYEPRVVHVEAGTNRIITIDDAVATLLTLSGRQPASERKPACPAIPAPAGPRTIPARLPMTLPLLAEKKRLGEPIVMVTAYDYPSARAAEAAGVDLVLVGDSGRHDRARLPLHDARRRSTTCSCSPAPCAAACARRCWSATCRSAPTRSPTSRRSTTALRFVKEAGCDAVKLEGGGETSVARARAIVDAGIPVMGHVGLTPQTVDRARRLEGPGPHRRRARRRSPQRRSPCRRPGCFAIVFEAIPSAVDRGAHAAHGDPRHRHRRRPGDRRPGARVPRPARHPRRAGPALRQALRQPPGGDGRGRRRLRRRRARARATRARSTPTRSTPRSSRTSAAALAEQPLAPVARASPSGSSAPGGGACTASSLRIRTTCAAIALAEASRSGASARERACTPVQRRPLGDRPVRLGDLGVQAGGRARARGR